MLYSAGCISVNQFAIPKQTKFYAANLLGKMKDTSAKVILISIHDLYLENFVLIEQGQRNSVQYEELQEM